MQIITLTTDLGTQDHFVASLKGDIVSNCPSANIVDISHNVEPFNVSAAAFVLKNAVWHYPQKTVHLVIVNAHDKREKPLLAALHNGQYFVCPDNGVLSLILGTSPEQVVAVDPSAHNGKIHSSIRSEIAIIGAQILLGVDLAEIGTPIRQITEYRFPLPDERLNMLHGAVLHIDAFKNIYVNITKDRFEAVRKERPFTVLFHRDSVSQISLAYCDAREGNPVCTFNSAGFMVIALNKGKAGSLLGIEVDSPILIEFE